MGDWFHLPRTTITLEEYKALEAAGAITRPLTCGPIQRRSALNPAAPDLGFTLLDAYTMGAE